MKKKKEKIETCISTIDGSILYINDARRKEFYDFCYAEVHKEIDKEVVRELIEVLRNQ
jgi:hypothetical protein